MKHGDRRREAGKMLMDVTKYLVTVGLIGGILTDNVSVLTGIALFVIAVIVFLRGFYAIPPKTGG